MFKYSKDGVSVLTILDTRRAKINGLFPVKVQVVFRRKQKYYSTGKELSKEDWDRLLKAKSQLLMEVRTDIEYQTWKAYERNQSAYSFRIKDEGIRG